MSKNFYEILEVDRKCTKDEIKKSFRRLAHLHHPDKESGSNEKFREVREAFEVLYDDERRESYDEILDYYRVKEELKRRGTAPPREEAKPKPPSKPKPRAEPSKEEITITAKITKIHMKNNGFYIFRFEFDMDGTMAEMVGTGMFFEELFIGAKIEIKGDIIFNKNYNENNFKCRTGRIIVEDDERVTELINMLNEESKTEKAKDAIRKYYKLNGFDYVVKNIKYSMRKGGNVSFYLAKSLENGWGR